jgi:outer membrane receptor protein involved in Fe transport
MVFLFAGTGWHSLWEETAGHLMVDYRRQDLEIRGYWNHMRLSIADAPLAAAYSRPVIVYSDLYDIEALNSQKVGRHGVLYGANFRRQEMGQSGYRFFVGPRHQNLWAAYAQDASRVSDSTNLVVNGRYDHHPLAGGRFSGRAAVMRSLSANRTLRLSAASAFRSPDFAESYAEMWYWGLFGNPDLKHEGITSYDIEYRLRLTPRTNASLAAYYSSIENLIHVEQFAGPPSYQQFSNLGNAQARGVEFEVNHALSPTLTAFANYTYQWLNGDWKIMRDRPDVILASPRHKANLGFTLADPDRRLNASLLLNYRDQATIGDAGPYVGLRIPGFGSGPYLLVNGYVGWRGPQGPEIGLSFFNLGNYRHQEYAQGDYIGRRIMGSVRWEF